MKLVLPMIFLALYLGLFERRINAGFWWKLVIGISLVVAYNYIKPD